MPLFRKGKQENRWILDSGNNNKMIKLRSQERFTIRGTCEKRSVLPLDSSSPLCVFLCYNIQSTLAHGIPTLF